MSASSSSGSSASGADFPIELAKAIDRLCKNQIDFGKYVQQIDVLIKDVFAEIDVRQRVKRRELEDLNSEFERMKRDKRIQLEQDFKQWGMEQAVKFLLEKGQIPVSKDDQNKLLHEVENLKATRDELVQKAMDEATRRFEQELERTKTTLELKHKAEVIAKEAQINQLNKHVEVLERVIRDLKNDVDQQRTLTAQVSGAIAANRNNCGPSSSSNSSSSRSQALQSRD